VGIQPQTTRRIGILDIGSNSIKFLVAEATGNQGFQIVHEKSSGSRLGEGIQQKDFELNEAAIQRTLDAIVDFIKKGEELGVSSWSAVATSAVRDAQNRAVFEQRFQERCGFAARVLSGNEEAELVYRAATSDPKILSSSSKILVMDSGGGSAEWILGDAAHIEKRISLDLGCVRMTDRFLRGDPYTEESYQQMMRYYEEQIGMIQNSFPTQQSKMVGTGGSICTAAALDLSAPSFHHAQIHGHVLSLPKIEQHLEKIRKLPNEQRLQLQGMPKKRADIVVAGIALFSVAMRIFQIPQITASLRGLRYGVLLEALRKR
jgi:exopolyphosphatase / guanosine-5'-triphosphate,3'-diphosphate pyrophosphatase